MNNLQKAKEFTDKAISILFVEGVVGKEKLPEAHQIVLNAVTSTCLQVVNQTLETQALALEDMKIGFVDVTFQTAYNTALEKAADHLREQKITE